MAVTVTWVTHERTFKEQEPVAPFTCGLLLILQLHLLALLPCGLPPPAPLPIHTRCIHTGPLLILLPPMSRTFLPFIHTSPVLLANSPPPKISCSLFRNLKHLVKTSWPAYSCTVLWLVYPTRLQVPLKHRLKLFITHAVGAWISDKILSKDSTYE